MEMINGFTFGIVGGFAVGFIYAHMRYAYDQHSLLKSLDEYDMIREVKRRRTEEAIKDEVSRKVDEEILK